MAMATTVANKPIRFVFAVRSLLFLLTLLLGGALTEPWPPRMPSTDLEAPIPDSLISQYLQTVNGVRSSVSPTASDMRYMTWSRALELEADTIGMTCSLIPPRPGVIYNQFNGLKDLHEMLLETVQQGETAIRDGRCKPNETHLHCRFYRHLMDASADRIGCRAVYCRGPVYGSLIYCFTNARTSDQLFVDHLYKKGTPCQMCPASSGYCYRNLCVSHATKTAILAETPSAVITCDAPCLNCGERKEVNNTCACQCPKGTSEVDCSKGSSSQTCSACRRAGTPCRNGGRDASCASGLCRCRCNGDHGGQFCEIPMALIVGGVVARLKYKSNAGFIRDADYAAEELKKRLADGINSFCTASQASYLECCGSGALPNGGPVDFVDASSVHVTCPVLTGQTQITCNIYATANGNNGLCRKRTSIPTPILAVPPNVVGKVIETLKKRLCCNVNLEGVIKSYADYYNVSMPKMNYISVKVG